MVAEQNGSVNPAVLEEGNDPTRFRGPQGPRGPPTVDLLPLMMFVNAITHILMGAVALSAFLFANIFVAGPLSQHIYLCVIGYVLVMAEGMLSVCPYSGWAQTFPLQQRKVLHMTLQGTGSVFVIVGSFIKILDSDPNFNSAHAILGIVAMIFTILTLIGGVFHFCLNMSRITRTLHFVCASLTLTIAFTSLIFAFHTYYRQVFQDLSANLLIGLTAFALIGVLFPSTLKTVQRKF